MDPTPVPSESPADYKARLHIALKAAKMCVFEVDLVAKRYTFFENAQDIYQKSGDQILRELASFSTQSEEEYRLSISNYFSHPDDHAVIDAAFHAVLSGQPASYTVRMRAGDTQYAWCKVDVTPILEAGVPVRMIGAISHLDGLLRQCEEYRFEAEHDAMTGLYNRQGLRRHMRALLFPPTSTPLALIVADLNDLKLVNDEYGHLVGDRALLDFSEALTRLFPDALLLGRWGGDEFVLLLPCPAEAQDDLKARFRPLMDGLPGLHSTTGSFGCSICADGCRDIETLFHQADQALYAAKQEKPAFVFYRPGESDNLPRTYSDCED